uniref:PUA domain-containing protein n=1 Tax=Chaetoceros debilis TaxID=122233 RepID=A0A7S3V789_9STRA
MFKRFDPDTDVSTSTVVKSSVQRGIKNEILTSHPNMEQEQLELLLPKKPPLMQYKVGPHLMLYCRPPTSEESVMSDNEPVFFQSRNGPLLPTLRLVHQYPDIQFNKITVDKGAIPFILGGANIMCPGLTNVGGEMPGDGDKPGLEKGDGVVIYAEGKEHALAVGVMTMSSTTIRSKNKGNGVEVVHFLGDGLFQSAEIS